MYSEEEMWVCYYLTNMIVFAYWFPFPRVAAPAGNLWLLINPTKGWEARCGGRGRRFYTVALGPPNPQAPGNDISTCLFSEACIAMFLDQCFVFVWGRKRGICVFANQDIEMGGPCRGAEAGRLLRLYVCYNLPLPPSCLASLHSPPSVLLPPSPLPCPSPSCTLLSRLLFVHRQFLRRGFVQGRHCWAMAIVPFFPFNCSKHFVKISVCLTQFSGCSQPGTNPDQSTTLVHTR